MTVSELVGKWVSIKWHRDDDPWTGKILREERGFHVLETAEGKEVPFKKDSLCNLEVISEPAPKSSGFIAKIRTWMIEKPWFWMNKHKMFTIFWSGVVIDFWANWYSYAIVHDWIILQAILGFFLPILNFPFIHWFIDEQDISVRFKMTLVTAFAMMLGSTLMLLMIRAGWGVGTAF
jgi:hypothetical protein